MKFFLDEDIWFFEFEWDVLFEEFVIVVGKVFIESYSIKFEDVDKYYIMLWLMDDVCIVCC